MKTICYVLSDGAARTAKVNRDLLAIMMGGGFFLENPKREVEKFARDIGEARAEAWILAITQGGLTEEQALFAIADKDQPKGTVRVELIDVPEDHKKGVFYNARVWRDGFAHDMDKAREIQRNRIRAARAPLLLKLDGARAAAIRKGDSAKVLDIDEKAQALADAPADPRINSAATVEELEKVWPEIFELLR